MTATLFIPNVSVGFFHEGAWVTANASHVSYTAIESAVGSRDFAAAAKMISLKEAVSCAIAGSNIELRGNQLYFQGNVVRGILGKRILEMIRLGHDCGPLELFLGNLTQNPSSRAVEELYGFLEVSQLPITDDGHFLAYKSVTTDFKDHHTGKMDNSVGAIVEMTRNLVDEDKDRTCSNGLHFAAHEYAKNFGSHGKMVVLKINPKDVVAIPSDYKNMKGRACRYEILEEVQRNDTKLINAQVVIGKTKDPIPAPYVAQQDNYDGDAWGSIGFGTSEFIGNASDFPINRKTPYDLKRTSNSKQYYAWFFTSYDEKNDNLVFRKHDGESFQYCTVGDLDDWDITVVDNIVLGS
jgi:hypothetical protein